MTSTAPIKTQALVLWVIWFSLVCAIPMYQVFLGGGWLTGEDARSPFDHPVIWLALAALTGAAVVRWLLIPKKNTLPQLLVLMIVGLALSEAVSFFGIFLFPRDMPETKMTLWVLSFASALTLAPLYARNVGLGR